MALIEPMAAIDSLKKNGASKSLIAIIEGESLFNDGIAVALIVFSKGIISNSVGQNIFLIVFKEIVGAIAVALLISFVMFKILKMTNEPGMHILISLLAVSLIYVICEHLGFSGVVASVVAGMYFSFQNKKVSRWKEVVDSKDLYEDFWDIASFILSGVLYVLVGLTVLSIEFNMTTLILVPVAIVLNLVARYASASVASVLVGKKNIPSKYSMSEFVALLTVTALKGGISLAITMTLKDVLTADIYTILLTTVFITILFTTIVQGLLAGKIYNVIEEKREKKFSEKSLAKIYK